MSLAFACPECRATIRVPDVYAGTGINVKCPKCRKRLPMSAAPLGPPPPPPPPPRPDRPDTALPTPTPTFEDLEALDALPRRAGGTDPPPRRPIHPTVFIRTILWSAFAGWVVSHAA